MEGRSIVTSDDHKLGTVVAERDDCVIIETGHVFKSRHALPREFVHEIDGELRATVPKSAFDSSPKVDDEHFDCTAIRAHYGLLDVTAEPEAEELDAALRR
jgi:homoserine trans-succinylase